MGSAVKELDANKFSISAKELQDDILETCFRNAQSSTRSVVYNVVEQVMQDRLCTVFIVETIDAHMDSCLKPNAAIGGSGRGFQPPRIVKFQFHLL